MTVEVLDTNPRSKSTAEALYPPAPPHPAVRTTGHSTADQLSMFEKSVSKMKLGDLMKATKENIIGLGRAGTMYKAVLEDGTSLMVKGLQDTQYSTEDDILSLCDIGDADRLVELIVARDV